MEGHLFIYTVALIICFMFSAMCLPPNTLKTHEVPILFTLSPFLCRSDSPSHSKIAPNHSDSFRTLPDSNLILLKARDERPYCLQVPFLYINIRCGLSRRYAIQFACRIMPASEKLSLRAELHSKPMLRRCARAAKQ